MKLETTFDIRKFLKQLPNRDVNACLEIIESQMKSAENSDIQNELKMVKASYLVAQGNYDSALDTLNECLEFQPSNISAHYSLLEYQVELGRYANALENAKKAIELSIDQKSGWFIESAYLLAAFCCAKLGDFSEAKKYCLLVRDDVQITWLRLEPVISRATIFQLIDSTKIR